eukprot:443484-Pleurochrysis_carterae.AAC.1
MRDPHRFPLSARAPCHTQLASSGRMLTWAERSCTYDACTMAGYHTNVLNFSRATHRYLCSDVMRREFLEKMR